MRITSKGRELADLAHLGDHPLVLNLCSRICAAAVTYERIQEDRCNGHPANSSSTMPNQMLRTLQEGWEKRCERQDEQLSKRITKLALELPAVTGVELGGDPRGCTVKLLFAGKRYDCTSRAWVPVGPDFPLVEISVPGG